jgi:AraC-like DNA-binding protein
MANSSCVTIHMAASLAGFIARRDGRVDWLETSDECAGGDTMEPGFVAAFPQSIDCYVMTSSAISIRLRDGYTSPSHFAQVFRRVAGVTPTNFRYAL